MKQSVTQKEWNELQRKSFIYLILQRTTISTLFVMFCHYSTVFLVPKICVQDRNNVLSYAMTFFLVACCVFSLIGLSDWFIKTTWRHANELVSKDYILKKD